MAERRDSQVSSGDDNKFSDTNENPLDDTQDASAPSNGVETRDGQESPKSKNEPLDEADNESEPENSKVKVTLEGPNGENTLVQSNGSLTEGEMSPVGVTAQSKEPSDSLMEATSPGTEIPPQERPPSPTKKLRNAFSWLSRSSTSESKSRPVPTPPLPPRRGTSTSITSNGSDVLSESAAMKKQNRQSLKDRFDSLRLRQLAGIGQEDEEGTPRPTSPEEGEVLNDKTEEAPKSRHGRSDSAASGLGKPKVNDKLPPGTAAGFATGPSADADGQVNWDLWQNVVYEGPAAVARTSPDELNKAITSGIPSAIRGVIWQVLAQSKNEDLESYYWALLDRGKGQAEGHGQSRPTSMRRPESTMSIEGREKDTQASSSAASIKSEATSRPASPNSLAGRPGSSVTSRDARSPSLTSEQIAAQEKKRVEEDASSMRKLEKAIKRDMGARTSYSQYLMSSGLQDGLFGICKAYALFDDAVGYAQGMNFIAMPLLFNMPEEEAFCLFVRLMNHYKLREMFVQDMPGLHLHLYQFERLLEDFEPALYCHLHRRGVSPQLYATQWFLTLFAYRFPLQLVLRIYDLILSEGLESAILKFGIVLMQKNAQHLLTMKDMAVLTTFLKERIFDVYIDASPSASSVLDSGFFGSAGGADRSIYRADALVKDACAVQIDTKVLKAYTSEWEEKVRLEKEKLAEEEALRASNKALTLKVRTLEGNNQKSDVEHTQIASELVRIKVDNQRLREDKEGLQAQIKELQDIIQAQPGEVEEKLQNEMNRIMERNGEVQNQNRHLEDALSEMENELVQTKLKLAETFSKFESFQTQWTNAQAAMNALNPNATK